MKTLITTSTLAFALALLAGAGSAIAQGKNASDDDNGMRCFNGYAYTLKGGDYRYTEHHEQKRENGKITDWDVTYVGDNGKTIATKHLDFSDNPTVPTYTLKMNNSGYEEGIRHQNGQWTMFRKDSADAKEKTKNFDVSGTIAADSGFNQLVQEKFDTLKAGKTVPFKFAAAGRESVVSLRARRDDDTTFEGKPAYVFIAELDMYLVNYFVNNLKLTYDPESHRLLEYRGVGNLHNSKGEVYPVRVTYSTEMPDVARKNDAPKAACGSVASKNG